MVVEPLREEAKAFFGDDMLLQDLVDAKERRYPRGGDGGGGGCGELFLDIFDHADEGLADGKGGEVEEEEEELEWLANKDAFPGLETSFDGAAAAAVEVKAPVFGAAAARIPVKPRSKGRRRRRSAAVAVAVASPRRRCSHCASEDTPQWRAGPDGPKTLCNACGVRFKSGRLVPEYRPARSPTFISALHSNSHRRILEMRRLCSLSAAATRGCRRGRGRRRRADSVLL